MKKTLLIILCGLLMLSVVACDKAKKPEPPKMDPPEWEELIDEYDDWVGECITYRRSYERDPENPVNQNMLKKWPRDIEDWEARVEEMLEELKDFPDEKSSFIAELKKISKELTGVEATSATSEEVSTFLDEYKAWADGYVAFEEANKDNKVSEEYKRARNDYIFESAHWGNMTANFKLRIEDAETLDSFNAEISKIEEKTKTLMN